MNEDFLDYFNRELEFFRKQSAVFGEQHTKIAGRLKNLEAGEHADPHVSRLIEALAFLNARIRLKLEDEFPQLCQAFLNILYPEYLSPFPSCGVVAFSSAKPHAIDRGTELQTPAIDGEPCRFKTCFPVQVWPFKIKSAGLETPPFATPITSLADDAKGVLRIDLEMLAPDISFDKLPVDRLRFFLNGDSRYALDLYELLFNNVQGIVLASSESDKNPAPLNAECIRPVGFEENESLLDYSARSRLGFHLLSEFFVFPEKFRFFDINLDVRALRDAGKSGSLKIFIYFDAMLPRLSAAIPFSEFEGGQAANQSIVLGAAPIINLFEKTAEPIILTGTKIEYRVVPDVTRPMANEVFSINKVWVNTESRHIEAHPFYSANHHLENEDWPVFWFMNRRDVDSGADRKLNAGSDVFISLVGFDGRAMAKADLRTLDVVATCFNRDYPGQLRTPTFSLAGKDSVVQTTCVVRPRETSRPRLTDESHWRLISHMNLNHLALTNDGEGASTLRETLRLYNFSAKKSINQMINGLIMLESKRIVGRVGGSISSGFCRGTEITVTLDQTKFSGGGEYLFGAVLDRFLALYTTINSFTKTVVRTTSGEDATKIFEWPPRTGDCELI